MTTPTISPIAEQIINTLHTRIDELVAERDALAANHKECVRCLGEALQDRTDLAVERDELAAAAKLALDALEWFVENDDTNIGMPGNEFWEDGLNQGIQTITALRQAGVQ